MGSGSSKLSVTLSMKKNITLQFSDSPSKKIWPTKVVYAWIEHALQAVPTHDLTELTVRFVGTAEGYALNQNYRAKNYATNVLTFCYQTPLRSADIVICTPILIEEAKKLRQPLAYHAIHILVHGVLHALGYDHIKARDARVMENLERKILGAIAPSYL